MSSLVGEVIASVTHDRFCKGVLHNSLQVSIISWYTEVADLEGSCQWLIHDSPDGGAPKGAPIYYFGHFPRQLYEILKLELGGGASNVNAYIQCYRPNI